MDTPLKGTYQCGGVRPDPRFTREFCEWGDGILCVGMGF